MLVNLIGALAAGLLLLAACAFQASQAVGPLEQTLKFDPTTNSYSGLTFTFEPQLDKQVQERLHFEHWLSIMQHTSSLMYESLNGRAHLNELRVLIPYKWRQLGTGWPILHKPGSPIINNRRLRHADADVLVGNEDPVYKETPFALQHDECGRPGLQIRMPIGFLEPAPTRVGQADEARLKGRQLLREFASHRYGVFKESGFRADLMYPPFTSVAGLPAANWTYRSLADLSELRNLTALSRATRQQRNESPDEPAEEIRGFDQKLRECKFESSTASGLPLGQAATCAPYLVRAPNTQQSFNLMGADLFTHATSESANLAPDEAPLRPIEWNEQLAELTTWHFCGENFAPLAQPADANNLELGANRKSALTKSLHFGHNQRASTKQNKMCQERSALDVIRASDDFRSAQFSPSSFNRLPAPSFKFLQEMPPRLIMAFEYSSHLFQSQRLDHAMLVAAVNKLLAFDLIADSEVATVMFGQHQARTLDSFQRLEASLSSRFAIFNPAIDPFVEQPQLYSQHELLQLGVQPAPADSSSPGQPPLKLLRGTCSFGRLMGELNQLLARSGSQYEDADADVVLLTSGLFVEDEQKIEDLIRTSNFKQAHNRLDLVIYPSGMLFDTKSRDGYIVLDSRESELIIKSRLSKLLLIERLTGARIHLIREQLDASGEFKMSTLTQFYQLFERLARGHSWDQTNSMMLLASQQVDSRQVLPRYQHQTLGESQPQAQQHQHQQQQQHSLSFSFELDDSIQNELLVGFIDPRVPQLQQSQSQLAGQLQSRAGKRFQLKNLQLRSPGGHLLFTETGTFSYPSALNRSGNELEHSDELGEAARQQGEPAAFFPHRAQLSLAAFHIRSWHLSQLQAGHKLAGTWTLSAISDEPVQTSGLAMARTNPTGDSLTAHCWIQTYRSDPLDESGSSSSSNLLRQVKVFAQVSGASELVRGRMEVQDEMGNIVQNVQMLDDGLGAPDITQNDGILSQVVQRATRAGFYRVMVELGVAHEQQRSSRSQWGAGLASGHDNICCGSSIPSDRSPTPGSGSPPSKQSKLPTRQLYCGTFHVEANNKLGQMRPPRISNLTAVSVDQDNRRITLRWFEPAVELSPLGSQLAANLRQSTNSQLVSIVSDNDLLSDEAALDSSSEQQQGGRSRRRMPRLTRASSTARRQVEAQAEQEDDEQSQRLRLDNVLIASHQQGKSADLLGEQLAPASANQQQLWSRYEIKLFTDRDVMKRTFDAKHEVGFRFNEWNVEGQLPNATQFGGMKEVTLRVPFAREGFYFVAMKVYNAQGISSHMSNIVQFYLRNNLTLEEVESIYNQPGTTMDAEGNVYDKNGELIHQRGAVSGSFPLLRGSSALDGWSVLVLLSLLVFIVTIMCLTLVACLASSARQSLAKKNKSLISGGAKSGSSGDEPKAAGTTISSLVSGAGRACGSGSSMVSQSSGCGSSQHSEVGACSSQESPNFGLHHQQHFHQDQVDSIMQTASELNLSKQMKTSYSQLQAQHKHQQHQAQLIHNQMISSYQDQQQQQQQEQEFYNSPAGYNQSQLPPTDWRQQQPLQHTLVNGYTYATVMPQSQQQQAQQLDLTGQPLEQQQYQIFTGDLNQNGLGSATPNELQAASMSGQYERVKREFVMRFSTAAAIDPLDGLPQVNEQSSPPTGVKLPPNYLNHQQLQQQLSSVLKSKRQQREAFEAAPTAKSSSPALEGVTGEFDDGNIRQLAYTSADQMAPPPPHYVYCTEPVDNNGLAPATHHQTLARDPSIYSKTTNLQQVPSAIHETNYYANHYDQPNSIGAHWPAQSGPLSRSQQQADHSAAISEV